MLTHEKLDFYVHYKGNWENWLRSREGIQTLKAETSCLLQDEDCFLIDNALQNLYLIKNGLTEDACAKELNSSLLTSCEDFRVVERLKELIPYKYGLWGTKRLSNRFINWVSHLFN
ncbi:hypothetical protein [Hymenobacter crusticola]|uniref:Uncharacterized protein n=1 Tax=Hymenobacter crusticola TaxID=1770526 RepID=A0A243WEP7_9BACT|nr:hypothetical protein [Hymenobacter crusticola]OUJ74183.1 hypothetical protein BXP70_10630 [Hymenobacter crusticola]